MVSKGDFEAALLDQHQGYQPGCPYKMAFPSCAGGEKSP